MINFPDSKALLACSTEHISSEATVLGQSREGRGVLGYCLGARNNPAAKRISLIGGCHADEPVGPMLLRHVVAYLQGLPEADPLLRDFQWWIVPHANPDGALRNDAWSSTLQDIGQGYDLLTYLQHVRRELPGDDMEFGFPRDDNDMDCRPENLAIAQWWKTSSQPFLLHASLHGFQRGGGPWFLFESGWNEGRSDYLKKSCTQAVAQAGYELHDVERNGEKGFVRLGKGFCSRPDSQSMSQYFLAQNNPDMAARFRPSSMETVRRLGGDPLTLVSEMPLFIAPGVGRDVGPPDPVALKWQAQFAQLYQALEAGRHKNPKDLAVFQAEMRAEIQASGLRPMPVADQLHFQWVFVASGVNQAMMFDSKN